jgi:DNA-binding transcriptional LysR family regulator
MDGRQLETLRAVRAQEGVTAAAAVLHLTPSAVSQQLAALQRDVGVPLTRQVGRRLRLTPAGEALADAAVDVAVALERARSAAPSSSTGRPGTVGALGVPEPGRDCCCPGLLTRVASSAASRVRCTEASSRQGDSPPSQTGWTSSSRTGPDGDPGWDVPELAVRVVPLLREPLDVAVPLGHRLAEQDRVEPDDLADEDWIMVREGFPVAAVLEAVSVQAGRVPRVVQRINDFHVVAALVAAGHGVSLLPRYTAGSHPGVRLVPLVGVAAGRRIDALLRPDRAERLVVRRVLDELVALAQDVTG